MSKTDLKGRRVVKNIDHDSAALKLHDEITCKGCFKVFSNKRIPKILHCLHNLCSECINMSFGLNHGSDTVTCPTCQIKCVGKSCDSFRTHSYVQIISDVSACYKDQINGTLKCIGCKNIAGLRCLTCNENYCQEHTDFHVRSRATSHHKVLSFKQILSAPLIVSTIKKDENCPTHTTKLIEFFCFTCKLPICTSCALSTHESCIYEELSIAVSALKEKFDNIKPAFNRKAYNLKKKTAILETGIKQLDGDLANSTATVADVSDSILRQLRQKEATMNLHIEEHRKESQGELRIHQSLVEEKIANIESGSDFVDTVFDYWNPVEVLTVENEIIKRLTELTAHPEEFSAENVKPKAYEMPPLLGDSVVDAVKSLENSSICQQGPD